MVQKIEVGYSKGIFAAYRKAIGKLLLK
jgi:hypothetical protein